MIAGKEDDYPLGMIVGKEDDVPLGMIVGKEDDYPLGMIAGNDDSMLVAITQDMQITYDGLALEPWIVS